MIVAAVVAALAFGSFASARTALAADEAVAVPIAEIQGTGPASPFVGQTVTTEGVVTAHYPSGGLDGYVIQTPGTGGSIDFASHRASDAVFVYAPGAVDEVAPGDTVRVRGAVGEYFDLTQIRVEAGDAEVIDAAAAPIPATFAWTADPAQRESLESMLVAPGAFTVTDTYRTNLYGEIGLAAGESPLRQPTDTARPGSAAAEETAADNAARAVKLDDGSTAQFGSTGENTPPYLSLTEPVRVGASVTFDEPVIMDYRFGEWKFTPVRHIVGDGTGTDGVTFENTRTDAPAPVGGDVSVASFNVLNYFTTLGDETASCVAYTDREGDRTSVREGCDQRGAWDAVDFERQQIKIVQAIDALDASVVGLMEIEDSARLGKAADQATAALVEALNTAAREPGKWDYVPSSNELPDASSRDVITNAIIYQPAEVEPVGPPRALGTASEEGSAFQNAREPIAQVFVPVAGGEQFLFSVTHFKSKGSVGPWPGDADAEDGQGRSNESRVRQAEALAAWIDSVKGDTEAVYLAGDFNSYTHEDPLQALYDAGYATAEAEFGLSASTYSFEGMSGSLDHVLMNDAAARRATGADIWGINSGESVFLEYGRFNSFGTPLYEETPYRSSDHDPIKVGLSARAATPTKIDILTINDFHGRLEAGDQGVAGAAVVAGAVNAHREANPNTLFVSAGDNIGASTFTSLIQQDDPTIDTLLAARLDVSAVGNHEFDRGFADLRDRVIPRFGGNTDPTAVTQEQRELGAAYGLGANVYERATGEPALREYAIEDVDGVRVAFIGTVTEDTAVMVDPAGIADIEFGDQAEAADRVAGEIVDGDLADVIVLLTHSGAAESDDCAALLADQSGFGALAVGVSRDIDAIVSAHTHQTYACDVPVEGTDGTRPVIQASEYGKALGQLELVYDTAAERLLSIEGSTFPLEGAYPADAGIAEMVAGYVAEADVIGAEPIGEISGDILRGGTPPGNDRGVESSMGNWAADVYLWATSENPAFAGTRAQIAIMNPGGLRADLLRGVDGVVTYKEAALVQPFANTLVTVTLTGAQIQTALEQQWKTTGDRPKLHLGISEGFSYEYVETSPRSGSIVSMSYLGEPISPEDTFTVVTNSFLSNGGDGFSVFAEGTDRTDTGQVDLDATLAYFRAFDVVDPAPLGRAVAYGDDGAGTGPGEQPGSGAEPGNGNGWGSDRPPLGSSGELATTGIEWPLGLALAIAVLLVGTGMVFVRHRGSPMPR